LALNNTASMNKRSPRTARGPVRWGGRTRCRRAHCLSLSAWRCTPCFSSRLAGGRKKHGYSVVSPRRRPSRSQARRAGGRERSRRDVRRRSARVASGCQPEPEEVMDAHGAAVDFRSRRGRPGASPRKPSAALSCGPFSTKRTRDSP
jgi:hypothetical protein